MPQLYIKKDKKLDINKGNIDMMSIYINTLIKISGDSKILFLEKIQYNI